ncbi:MAG: hypothetical protein WAL25_06255 [Acidimicrobiia bacterium]
MTYVSTPSSGALQRKQPRKFSSVLVAAAIVVASGAAIAIGITVMQDASPTVTGSLYPSPEVLKNWTAPGTSSATNQVDPADRVHMGRTPAMESASEMSHGAFVEPLEDAGLIPSGAIPTGATTEATDDQTGLR